METDVLREALAEPPTPEELTPLQDDEALRLRRENELLRIENARLHVEITSLRGALLTAEEDFAERLTRVLNASLLSLREAAPTADVAGEPPADVPAPHPAIA